MCSAPQQEARYEAVGLGAPGLLVQLLSESLATADGGYGARTEASLVCKALARLAAVLAGRVALARAGGVAALAAALRARHGMPEAVECLQVRPCQAPHCSAHRWQELIQGHQRLCAAMSSHPARDAQGDGSDSCTVVLWSLATAQQLWQLRHAQGRGVASSTRTACGQQHSQTKPEVHWGQALSDHPDSALALLAPADGVVAALADSARPGSVPAASGAYTLYEGRAMAATI